MSLEENEHGLDGLLGWTMESQKKISRDSNRVYPEYESGALQLLKFNRWVGLVQSFQEKALTI
jgi:hypothetical protein